MDVNGSAPQTYAELADLVQLRLRGLPAALVHAPWQESLAVYLRVRCGYADDPTGLAGLAHVCEHERVTYASTLVPPLGPVITGHTHAAWTDYRLVVPAEHWQHGLLQALAVLHPERLPEDRLSKEVQAVLIEMARNVGRPALRLGPLLASAAAVGTDIAAVGTATERSVRGITPSAVADFLSRHYRPTNCQLAVTSPVSSAEIAGFLESRMPTSGTDAPPAAPRTTTSNRPQAEPDLSGTVAMAISADRPPDPGSLIAQQLAHMYLADAHGRLDRVSAQVNKRIAGATTVAGSRSQFTALSWGQVQSNDPVLLLLTRWKRQAEVLSVDDFVDARERLYLKRSYELQTPLGMAGQVLRWIAGEDGPPLTRDALDHVPVEHVNEAVGALRAGASLWQVTDGVPLRLDP